MPIQLSAFLVVAVTIYVIATKSGGTQRQFSEEYLFGRRYEI